MKILFIEYAIDGHHVAYLTELVNDTPWVSVAALPERINGAVGMQQYVYTPLDWGNRKLIPYLKWMWELRKLADREQIDIVHFLSADLFYKFFGLGLGFFRKFRVISTLHWIRPGRIAQISLRIFSRKMARVVVHSDYLCKELQRLGLRNGVHIEYPQFKRFKGINVESAKDYWNLMPKIPTILSLGGTRVDKGLDILLEALKSVNYPFQLLIAGKSESFDEKYISEHTKKYSDCVRVALRYLTDDEVEFAVAASDIIALPYRHSFNGASGPLGEGVCRDKCIIGSDHGNLGHTICENHLGYTFETENTEDLARVLNEALSETFTIDEVYEAYKVSLNPQLFVESYKQLYEDLKK